MRLPAPKWFAWIYAILFWVFVIAGLLGNDRISAVAYIGLGVMFFGLAVAWVGAIVISGIYKAIRR